MNEEKRRTMKGRTMENCGGFRVSSFLSGRSIMVFFLFYEPKALFLFLFWLFLRIFEIVL